MKIKIGPQLVIMKIIKKLLESTPPVEENAVVIQQPTCATSPKLQSSNQHGISPAISRFSV